MSIILVAVDGSDHAYKAVEVAADLADKRAARLLLLHVVSEQPLSDAERRLAETEYLGSIAEDLDVERLMEARGDVRVFARSLLREHAGVALRLRRAVGQRYLDEAGRRARARGVRDIETLIEVGEPADEILAAAAAHGADMIVTGSRGLGDLRGALFGSVSHRVAHHAPVTCVAVT